MKRLALTVFVCLALALFLTPTLAFSQPKYGGTLTLLIQEDIYSLDIHKSLLKHDGLLWQLLSHSLVEPDLNFTIKPALAESWDVTSDSKEWIFYLRKGVKFHNGREMTAEDIKFNIERIIRLGGILAKGLAGLDRIEVVDRYTVKFIMNEPTVSVLASLGGTALRSPIMAPECVNEDDTVTDPIGVGPFQYVKWSPGEGATVKRFDDYFIEGLPYLDEVVIMYTPDETVRLTALRADDVQISQNLVPDVMQKDIEGCVFSDKAFGFNHFCNFNCSEPPFDNVKVRQAAALAMNREEQLITFAEGAGTLTNQLFGPKSPWHADVPIAPRNVEKAKALLKEAGYPDGLKTTMNVWAIKEAVAICTVIQANLKEVGIELELKQVEAAQYYAMLRELKFKMGITGWSILADPIFFYPDLFSTMGANRYICGNWTNPVTEELFAAAAVETDPEKRQDMYKKATEIIIDQVPVVFIFHPANVFGWRDYVKGWEAQVDGNWVWAGGGLSYTWMDK